MTSFSPDPEVGVMSMDNQNVASTDKMAETELVPSQDDVVFSSSLFIVWSMCLGYMWVVFRVLISQTAGKEIISPGFIAVAIVIIMITALFLLLSIYICCFFVYCVVILLMPRLPKKIKVVFDTNHIVVSTSASCCSLFLAAIFFWRLEKCVKFVLADEVETMPIPKVILLFSYAIAFTFFLSVAAFSTGIRRQLIIMIKRHMVGLRRPNSS